MKKIFKMLKNKKGTAPFVEALILSPIVILIFLMIISNLFCYTKTNSAELIGRQVVRACIVCDSAIGEDNSMQKVVYNYFTDNNKPNTFKEYYIREVKITNLNVSDTNSKYSKSIDFGKNIKGSEFSEEKVKSLDPYWEQGNMLSITFYFSSLGLSRNFGEIANHTMSLVPSGVYITISQIIENDKG